MGTDESRRVLNGEDIKGDRSESLTTALHEWYGWQNWTHANSLPITGTPEKLAYEAGTKLGIDNDRVGRILQTINSLTCQPACIHSGGELSAWRKIARLNPGVFERICPQNVKVLLTNKYANSDSAQNVNDTDEDSINSSVTESPKAEQLKLEIIAWLNLSDVVESALEKSRICSHYSIAKGTFDQISCQIQAGKETSRKPQMLTLREASLITTPNVEYLVDGWLPRRDSVVCSGLPGTGKTLITADLAFAVSTGGVFLGAQARKGKVLVLNSDQQLDITVSYLQERGCDFDDDSIYVVGSSQESDAWTILYLDALEGFLEKNQPDLVIIDSIRSAVVFPLGVEEKSEMIGGYIQKVNRLVLRYASVIWVHHDAKDEGRRGVTKSSGSTAIVGCNSFHWGLELVSENPTDPRRKLSVHKTRRIPPQAVEIKLDPTQGFELIGPIVASSKPQQPPPKLRDQILLIFQSHPEKWIKSAEIREIVNSESAYTTLNRLTQEGTLAHRTVDHGRGTEYRLSSPED